MITITRQQLLKIMPNASSRVDTFLPYLNKYAINFNITTPLRWAHYLAQIAHESLELKYTQEIASGRAYEGRKDLGNIYPGDGVKFKGRGLIQITGRANYNKYQQWCEQQDSTIKWSVVKTPSLLENPLGAVRSSMWFWNTHNLNAYADRDDIRSITHKINGGYNGLTDRNKYLFKAKLAFGL